MLNNPPWLGGGPPSDPFVHGQQGRRLRLVVDDVTVGDSLAVSLLEQLEYRPSARVHWTARQASGRVTLSSPVLERDYVPAAVQDADDVFIVAIPRASRITERSREIAREHAVDEHEVERLLRLATLGRTCDRIDAIVVGASLLAERRFSRLLLPHGHTPAEALALLGLNLRAHGDFVVGRDGTTTRLLGSERFYRAVAFEHVAGLDDWIGAGFGRWMDERHQPLRFVDGIATRMGRAFRARDYLQVRLRAHDLEAVWGEVLFFFDAVLVQAMGAMDILARLFHDVYAIRGSEHRASWRSRGKDGWVARLREAAPDLGALSSTGGPVGDIVDLVAELRNAIHNAPLTNEMYDNENVPGITDWDSGVIAVAPTDRVDTMLAAAQRHDGLAAWGISDRRVDGAVVVDPGLFAELALRSCATALAQLLARADLGRLNAAPPGDVALWVPDRLDRESAAALFGLSNDGLRQERATFA